MTNPNARTFKRRLSVSLADVSVEGLRQIMQLIDSEASDAKTAADTAATPEVKQRMNDSRARLIESSRRIERFLDR